MSDYHQFCGLARALDVIGDRWNLLIVRELLIADRRHHELKAALAGIATNLLSERLRGLAAAGIVVRREEPGRKAVVYSLTDLGAELREPVLDLVRWGGRFMADGPRAGDSIQPHWLLLAIEALLSEAVHHRAGGILVRADGMELTVQVAADGVSVEPGASPGTSATIEGPTAVVLGVFSGTLALDPPLAGGARIEDPDGFLAATLAAVARG